MKNLKSRMLSLTLVLVIMICMAAPAYAASVNDFTDVPAGAWYYEAVDYAVNNKMVEGTSSTAFTPGAPMTRGQFVAILSRWEGNVDFISDFPASGYADVSPGDYYFQHINWLKQSEISDVSGAAFRPDAPILRDELVIMLGKYLEYKGVTLPDDPTAPAAFMDADKISAAAKPNADILRKCGMLVGDNGYLNPQANMTRAEGVTVFMRIGQKIETGEPGGPEEPKPSEPPDWENYNPTYDIPTGKSAVDAEGGYYDYDLANELMRQINELRIENGVKALLYNPKVQDWASIRAKEHTIIHTNPNTAHTRPDGSHWSTVGQGLSKENLLWADSYTDYNKNNAANYASEKLMVAWYNSELHRNTMLESSVNIGAVSCYVRGNNVYIAHLFSNRTLYFLDYLVE